MPGGAPVVPAFGGRIALRGTGVGDHVHLAVGQPELLLEDGPRLLGERGDGGGAVHQRTTAHPSQPAGGPVAGVADGDVDEGGTGAGQGEGAGGQGVGAVGEHHVGGARGGAQ